MEAELEAQPRACSIVAVRLQEGSA